jgi:hypothetical protein
MCYRGGFVKMSDEEVDVLVEMGEAQEDPCPWVN